MIEGSFLIEKIAFGEVSVGPPIAASRYIIETHLTRRSINQEAKVTFKM